MIPIMQGGWVRWSVVPFFVPARQQIAGTVTELSPPRHTRLRRGHYRDLRSLARTHKWASIQTPVGGMPCDPFLHDPLSSPAQPSEGRSSGVWLNFSRCNGQGSVGGSGCGESSGRSETKLGPSFSNENGVRQRSQKPLVCSDGRGEAQKESQDRLTTQPRSR